MPEPVLESMMPLAQVARLVQLSRVLLVRLDTRPNLPQLYHAGLALPTAVKLAALPMLPASPPPQPSMLRCLPDMTYRCRPWSRSRRFAAAVVLVLVVEQLAAADFEADKVVAPKHLCSRHTDLYQQCVAAETESVHSTAASEVLPIQSILPVDEVVAAEWRRPVAKKVESSRSAELRQCLLSSLLHNRFVRVHANDEASRVLQDGLDGERETD